MSRGERVRRWVDGELSADEAQRLEADALRDAELGALLDEARRATSALRLLATSEEPPPSLAERSLAAALEARAAPRAGLAERLARLMSPRWIRFRLSPPWILLPAVAALLFWALGRQASEPLASTPAAPPAPSASSAHIIEDALDDVPVRFVLPAAGAQRVTVAGDFNGWDTETTELSDSDGDGVFVGTAYLPRGDWTYMFVVDGTRWVSDPYAQSFRDDGFGGQNAVLRIN